MKTKPFTRRHSFTEKEVETITAHFIFAAEWSSTDKDGTPLNDSTKYGNTRWPKKERAKMKEHVERFLNDTDKVARKASDIYGLDYLGHDIWLNCAGHGVGFWDRNNLAVPSGRRLVLDKKEGFVNPTRTALSIGEYLDKACEKHRVESIDAYWGWYYLI